MSNKHAIYGTICLRSVAKTVLGFHGAGLHSHEGDRGNASECFLAATQWSEVAYVIRVVRKAHRIELSFCVARKYCPRFH